MKTIIRLLLLFTCLTVSVYSQGSVFFDNFDSYTPGEMLSCSDSSNWITWSGAPCDATEDPEISSNQSFSPGNSVKIVQSNDFYLKIGQVLTSGHYKFMFQAYIPQGKSGYFNFLSAISPSKWAFECHLDTSGAGRLKAAEADVTTFTWPEDVWFPVEIDINLDTDEAKLSINSVEVKVWQYSLGSTGNGTDLAIAANDLYGFASTDEMYIDDYNFYDYNLTDIEETMLDVSGFSLGQNYPNPFNPSTTIDFIVPESDNVVIEVYDVNGRIVTQLLNEEKGAGKYSVTWDGKDQFGKNASSGTYFYQIKINSTVQTKKMILLK